MPDGAGPSGRPAWEPGTARARAESAARVSAESSQVGGSLDDLDVANNLTTNTGTLLAPTGVWVAAMRDEGHSDRPRWACEGCPGHCASRQKLCVPQHWRCI